MAIAQICPEMQEKIANSSCFSTSNLLLLKSMMSEMKVEADSCLFWEGDPADKLYFIEKGKVKLSKANEDGKEFVFFVFREGDFLGQADPYSASSQIFTAKAEEDCIIGTISKQDLESVLWQNSTLTVDFMKWMGLMHRLTQSKFRDLLLYGKSGALCSTMIRLANTYGKVTEDGIWIQQKLTNHELADYIGAARESVNRMLGEWRRKGIVDQVDGHLLIKDLNYFRTACHCEDCPIQVCRI